MIQPVPQPADIPVGLLLPQQPPFVMIDTLCRFDEREVETVLTVRPDNVFVDADDGCLSVCGMVENMAQTCAARLGYINYIRRETIRCCAWLPHPAPPPHRRNHTYRHTGDGRGDGPHPGVGHHHR